MGTKKTTTKTTATAKRHSQKRHRRILHISVSTSDPEEGSIFDDLSELERVLAFSYYYEHPEELPDRQSGAERRASQKALRIKVKFDTSIFERKQCSRPIPAQDLEEVDPLTVASPPVEPNKMWSLALEMHQWYSPVLS